MKRSFIRLASTIFCKQKPAMAPSRYFANPLLETDASALPLPPETLAAMIDDIDAKIRSHLKPTPSNAGDGAYLGTAGVAYAYYHLSKTRRPREFVTRALEYLTPAVELAQQNPGRKSDLPGFILGTSGVYAVAAAIYSAVGDGNQSQRFREAFYGIAPVCKQAKFLRCGSDELFVGRAGYVLGALWLAKETDTPIQKRDLFEICRVMVASGRDYSQRHNSPSPLMYSYYDVEYLGAAHGLCTILQALISVPDFLDSHPSEAEDVKASVDYLLGLQDEEGNFPAATDEAARRHNELVHWCHGAPGVVYLMAKAYLVWREEKYLKACGRCADLIWAKGLLKKGPGICHGVAGNGYAFLLMYRLTEDERYLRRAEAFARFLESEEFKLNARTPDSPYSLYEGIAGTACFLADLANPAAAAFPFSDVFATYK